MDDLDKLIRSDSATGLGQLITRLQQLEALEKLVPVSNTNVSDPPTNGELDAIFGPSSTLPEGYSGIVDDNGTGTAIWLSTVVNSLWQTVRFGLTGATDKSWAFDTPSGSSGTFYFGGYYFFGASDNDFSPSITFGSVNASYAAHFFVVVGSVPGNDVTLRVTGTSINDNGVRNAADTADIFIASGTLVDTYFETSKKWLGQITISVVSGTPITCNYGFCKYWDNNNTNFTVSGVDVTWLGSANDNAPNILLRHHETNRWTFNAGSTPTPPPAIAEMNTDHVTEIRVRNGENGAWKRVNLNTAINGGGSEGTIIEIQTTANKAFELGNFTLSIKPA